MPPNFEGCTMQVTTAYDAAGQVTSITNARGKVTSYTYDALGNQLTETDPLGRVTTNVYDLAGRLTSTTDPRSIQVTYAYDNANRLTTTTFPGGTVTNTYDNAGRRTQMVDATGATAWAYDAAGRTTSVTSPQGIVSYTYNAAGQRATMTQPGSRTVSYSYDTAGRLASLTDWGARTTTFGYNADSQRTTVTRPGALVTTNSYNAAGWLTGVEHKKNATVLQTFTYTYDAAGNRTSQVGPNGTESYTLDALGRLTSATIPSQGTTTYSYDANGNRLTKVNGATTTNYTYDDADQLTLEGATSYTYDNAGNMTARGTSTYTYDWRGRMTSSTTGGTTTTYTYDGNDVRVKKQTGAATTTYLWDRESGLPLLIDDGTNGYVHQGTGNPLTQTTLAGGTPKWLLTDALGSVRGAADAAGALTGSANYDSFGAPYGTDSTGSALGYTGEQRDSETGFEFLRARYYNPASGRFTARDSLFPAGEGTQGFNRYVYAGNNPTTWTDPTGHLPNPPFGLTVPQLTVLLELTFGARLAEACARTLPCNIGLGAGIAMTFTGGPVRQWGGALLTTFALVACALDIEEIDEDGPPGIFIKGGDHCFATYKHPDSNIRNCVGHIADLCLPSPERLCAQLPSPIANFMPGCSGAGKSPVGGYDCEVLITEWQKEQDVNIDHIWKRHGPAGESTSRFTVQNEAELRELLHEALSDSNGSLQWDDDGDGCACTYSFDRYIGRSDGRRTNRVFIKVSQSAEDGHPYVRTAYPIPGNR